MEVRKIRYGQYSIIGDRSSQQDSSQVKRGGNGCLLACVCDGMGGMEGGELASSTAIQTIFDDFSNLKDLRQEAAAEWMKGILASADQKVAALRTPAGKPLGGGTTCVLVLAYETGFLWGNVGDSRIYLIREGRIFPINRMHNFNLQLDYMVQTGTIDMEERERLGARGEALISFLGIGGLPIMDIGRSFIPWMNGDVVLLCSDGLYKAMDDQQILAVVEESGENEDLMARRLCNEASRLSSRSQDNTTVIIVRYEEKS